MARKSTAKQKPIDDAFAALADRTRRAVVDRLRQGPQRAGELATVLAISPPALSRHLRVLTETRLIEAIGDDTDARVRVFRLRPEPFAQLRTWLDDIEATWTEQLTAFAAHVERTRGAASTRRTRRKRSGA